MAYLNEVERTPPPPATACAGGIDGGRMICYCLAVRAERVVAWIEAHPGATLQELIDGTEAGSWCLACRPDLQEILDALSR